MEEKGRLASEFEHIVRKISFPRYDGTESYFKGNDIILEEADKMGLKTKIQTFDSSEFFRVKITKLPYFFMGIYVCIISLIAAFAVNHILNIIFGAILCILALVIEEILRVIKYPLIYSRWAEKHKSQNIILNPDAVTNLGQKTDVIVFAHTDTKSESPSPHPLMTIIGLSILIGSLVYGLHLLIFSVIALINSGIPPHNPMILIYGLIFGIIDMLRILTKYFEGKSPGANDDAIGVAVTLHLQKFFLLPENQLKNINLVCVLTGAEELGEIGAYQFIREHQDRINKEKSHFLVLDGLTGKRIYYFPSHGLLKRPFSNLFLTTVDEMREQNHPASNRLEFIRMWMPPPVNTDHSPVVELGYNAFIFASPEDVSHSVYDTPDKIDYDGVADFFQFLKEVLKTIDKKL